jgi:GNAT superfamily N-acetyltransferase
MVANHPAQDRPVLRGRRFDSPMSTSNACLNMGGETRTQGNRDFVIESLTRHGEFVPAIAGELWREWGYSSVGRCADDLARCETESLPIRLVAVAGNVAVGIVNLIESNLPTHTHLRPWLAGLYVWPQERRRGVGTALCAALEGEARRLELDHLYLYTESAEGFYRRLGWSTVETAEWEGEPIAIMVKHL